MMLVQPKRNHRQDEQIAIGLLPTLRQNALKNVVIGRERHMPAVVLDRANRDGDHRLRIAGDRRAHLGPGQMIVAPGEFRHGLLPSKSLSQNLNGRVGTSSAASFGSDNRRTKGDDDVPAPVSARITAPATPDAVGGPGRYVEVDSLLIPT